MLHNQSLASDTSHAISWSTYSFIQLTSCNLCNYTPYTPIDKLGDYPTKIHEVDQRVVVERYDQSQQCDVYPISIEGSLEGYNLVQGGLCNSGGNNISNADIVSAAFLPEVDGLSKSACIEAHVDTSVAQSKKRKREVAGFGESPSSQLSETRMHSTVVKENLTANGNKLGDGSIISFVCNKVCNKIYCVKQQISCSFERAHASLRSMW